jgi:hypothetical protein
MHFAIAQWFRIFTTGRTTLFKLLVLKALHRLTGVAEWAKGARATIYLCPRHYRRKSYCWGSMIALLAGGWIAMAWLLIAESKPGKYEVFIPWILPFIPTIIAGWAMGKLATGEWNPWFVISRIDGSYVHLRGACRKFRDSLPPEGMHPLQLRVSKGIPPRPLGAWRPPDYPKVN